MPNRIGDIRKRSPRSRRNLMQVLLTQVNSKLFEPLNQANDNIGLPRNVQNRFTVKAGRQEKNMGETQRAKARELARKHLAKGDALGWFEVLYAQANGDASAIPWADLTPNPNLVDWLDGANIRGMGQKAIKIGCGLGDDAEELALRGFDTTAFDISQTAISWCRRRHPHSLVTYLTADVFDATPEWQSAFSLVVESYTLQVLTPDLRRDAIRCIADFVAPGGTLLIITRGREATDPEGKMPWPLTKEELALFRDSGMKKVSFEDYVDNEAPPVRRFRAVYRRET